eukprot:TRINITY_DN1642_c0_g1_i2.p1 TRINITY_DN1642_c0_g1~~TRINITY_DN1642_c0_g1_i2.p1  ORF type:complete len:135 (-),score=25.47 TRINITY_DN1642_c0_g1_i2:427-831(-)
METMAKSVLLIDGSYLFLGSKKFVRKLDTSSIGLQKLVQKIEERFQLLFTRKYYFDSTPNPPVDSQSKYFTRLRSQQFRVELTRLKQTNAYCHNCKQLVTKTVQAGTDVSLATTMLTLTCDDQLDNLVLIAGSL